MKSDRGYERRIPSENRFELADYSPHDLAEIFKKMAEGKRRVLGDGVTTEVVAELIAKHTSEAQRGQLNGTIAERLLEKTEAAMDKRNGESVPPQLVYELADVTIGASSETAAEAPKPTDLFKKRKRAWDDEDKRDRFEFSEDAKRKIAALAAAEKAATQADEEAGSAP